MKPRIIVAMSGGVDSSVVAARLHHEGYDVVGVTLQLYDHGAAINKAKACCAGQDIQDAKAVADRIGFPHYTLDYESRFKQAVMDDFADSYLRGETPIPCVQCNQTVKFRDLLAVAKDLGGAFLATGHYVQRVEGTHKNELHQGADPAKDQSYFLFQTTQEQLDFLRFPLGGLNKAETRRMAAEYGLSVADKPDSQDICFVPNGDYASVVEKLRPGAADPGEIVHLDGRILGQHAGIIHYTIGQRKGLGIGGRAGDADSEALYVVRLEPETRRVVVGSHAALGVSEIFLRGMNWLGDAKVPEGGMGCAIKIRSTRPPVAARLYAEGRVVFAEPQFGVSPGQAGVVYQGTRCLGGGWITKKANI
ncbi:MAG: tRNA 2-thiouridine(34) synthase MnmA [Alphaproteobacteria bacterium]|nr:tRNA 2-thiouridine(34) synthase MnmA [Alphaproteobacteria bacterium]